MNTTEKEQTNSTSEIPENPVDKIPKQPIGFFKKNKAKIIKLAVAVVIIACFSVGCYILFDLMGFMDGSASKALSKYGAWVYVIFVALFVLQALCLCMIPGNTTLFITLAWLLFDNFWEVFMLCVVGIWLGGIALFFVGRFGGRRVLYWLFGKEAVEKKLDWVTQKGASALPAFFLVPFMPNDMICMVCGMSRLRFWQFLMIIIPFRIIEVLMILSYPYLVQFFIEGREPQDVLILINVLIIDIFLIAMYYRTLIHIFKKTILRRKFIAVEKPLVVYQEVKRTKTPRCVKG